MKAAQSIRSLLVMLSWSIVGLMGHCDAIFSFR